MLGIWELHFISTIDVFHPPLFYLTYGDILLFSWLSILDPFCVFLPIGFKLPSVLIPIL